MHLEVAPVQVRHWLSQLWQTLEIAMRFPLQIVTQLEPSRLKPDWQLVQAVREVQFRQGFTHD